MEETRAELQAAMEVISLAPFANIIGFEECDPQGSCLYEVQVDDWRNCRGSSDNPPYKTFPHDLVLLANGKPKTVSDLQGPGRFWSLAVVTGLLDDDDEEDPTKCTNFTLLASKGLEGGNRAHKSVITLIFLTNITTNE
ncbi:unnamed protein product [Linum trigynum]|uniref:DUF6469 domain-containing protein n=1 Tax=Linum trigynum TaxID=586398 RepID=A0AAV2EH73_9ROSI